MIENAIKSLLLGDKSVASANSALTAQAAAGAAALAALIGTRVYRAQLPRNAAQLMQNGLNFPAIWFWRLDTKRQQTHDGPLDLVNGFVGLHAVGMDTFIVSQVLDAARKLLGGWKGAAGQNPLITVDMIWVEGGKDFFEDPIGSAELGIAESNIELNCWFRESLA